MQTIVKNATVGCNVSIHGSNKGPTNHARGCQTKIRNAIEVLLNTPFDFAKQTGGTNGIQMRH